MIVQDNFCEVNSRGQLIPLAAFKEWIDEVSGAEKAVKVSMLSLVAILIIKLVI